VHYVGLSVIIVVEER